MIIGNLVVAGWGALLVDVFGQPIYHWYLTGELWITLRADFGVFATFDRSPVAFIIEFGLYALCVGLGIFCLAAGLIQLAYYRRHPKPED
ncbi:MAG TPA: hypothetical protein VKY22_21145 [Bradyrhizobium sp.]|nr:hypothetical protein [Bradyrhizobium sp.]